MVQFGFFNPFVVGIFGGNKKPNVKILLFDFIKQLKELVAKPVQINGNHYEISIFCFTCDAPARSMLKSIVQHTGYFSCERCTIKGSSKDHRIVFNEQEDNVVLRTNELFRDNKYCESDNNGKCHQLNKSPLVELPFNIIKDFSLDYMHLVCLGVMRHILYFYKGTFKGVFEGRLSSVQQNVLSDRLVALNGILPTDFVRQPRSLSELDRWKATELRSFLLYTGIVVLKGILSKECYKHFLSLSLAIRMLCEKSVKCLEDLSSAEELIYYFVNNAKQHYGNTFVVYNVHSLLHITDDVEHFSSNLHDVSAFQFENYLQKLKRLVHGKHNPVSQIANRLSELKDVSCLKEDFSSKINVGIKDSCFLVNNGVVYITEKRNDGSYRCRFYNDLHLESFFHCFIGSKELNIYNRKKNAHFIYCRKQKSDLIRKCVSLPYKSGYIVIPLLEDL